jgi:carboxylate-amine ligase
VHQNKWRASRYGLDAVLVDPLSFEPRQVRVVVERLAADLRPAAQELGCSAWLDRLVAMSQGECWADRQLAVLKSTGDPAAVVRHFTDRSRLAKL